MKNEFLYYNYDNVIDVIRQNNEELPFPICGKLCAKSRYVVQSKIDGSVSQVLAPPVRTKTSKKIDLFNL